MASSRTRVPERPATAVTPLLQAWGGGDLAAGERLFRCVYADLHRQAARAMRLQPISHTLQTTALVHEAYLRIADRPGGDGGAWLNRAHFLGVAARAMRHVLVDHARARLRAKRGRGQRALSLGGLPNESRDGECISGVDVLALHEALDRLAALDPDQAHLVELRYFGGLTIEDTASALGISPATVKREWAIARAWLRRELQAP